MTSSPTSLSATTSQPGTMCPHGLRKVITTSTFFRRSRNRRTSTSLTSPLSVGGRTFTVIGPDDTQQQVTVLSQRSNVVVHVPRPRKPGFYRVHRDGQVIATASVNVDPRESDPRPIAAATLRSDAGGDGSVVEIKGQGDLAPVLDVHGRPLWPWLVAAAMGALGVEMTLLSVWRR